MNDPSELIGKASAIVGTEQPVIAAGIFGLKDDYLAVGLGTAAGASLGDAILDNPLASGVGGAAAMHATRSALAASNGLTVRMLVAVTPELIRVLDWETGSGPTTELLSFDRSSTDVKINKFGLSRHVELHDSATGQSLALSGSTAPFVSESKGDKAVLKELSDAPLRQ
ncbi:MAG: hypothetical protein IVW52_19450 [Acidimicrobiales bacterium]|nr:hypothetical protein [Acidimicrobiales bacterium]